MENKAQSKNENNKKSAGKAARNIVFIYLLTSLVSGKPEIFVSFSMSFPFVLPMMLERKESSGKSLILSGFMYALPGILIAFAFSRLYDGINLMFPAAVSLFSLVCLVIFTRFQGRLEPQKSAFLKTSVIFLIFILCLTS